jgi:hypothetical protein
MILIKIYIYKIFYYNYIYNIKNMKKIQNNGIYFPNFNINQILIQ